MPRRATAAALLRLLCGMVCLAVAAGRSDAQRVGAGTSVAVSVGAPGRFTAGPPLSLGQRSVGSSARRGAMLSVADSILRVWGWQAASVDVRRSVLRTEWQYFAGTEFTPSAGRPCEDGIVVGLRFELAPRQIANDSAVFVLRGEALIVDGNRRADAERFARGSFGTIGAALQAGAREADLWPDTVSVAMARLSGEVGMRVGQRSHGCVTIRP